jgi:gliding motility-associated-like protein
MKIASLFTCLFLFISVPLLAQPPHTIEYTGNASFCQGGSLILEVTGTLPGTTFLWVKDGNDIASETTNTYTAITTGSYTVKITEPGNPTETPAAVNVIVNAFPTAGFTFNNNNQCSNVPIQFTNSSTGSNLSYTWTFGDPSAGSMNNSADLNPLHRFIGTPGSLTQAFPVKLVTSSNGCKDSLTQIITAKQLPAPILGGTGASTYNNQSFFTVCNNSSTAVFSFVNQSNTTNNLYHIIWGDATPDYSDPAFSSPTTHTYSIGTNKILFIVTGANNCIDTSVYNVYLGTNPAIGLGNPGNTSICTDGTLIFPITLFENNPPGTTYNISFNDGSPTTPVFPTTLNNNIAHEFKNPSCGSNSGTYPNSFTATLVATNPCFTTSATVAPIYVSQKPKPNFTIGTTDTVCVNNNVPLTNTSTQSSYIASGGSCNGGKSVWKITPATGFTIIGGGTLGNDNNSVDPSLWVSATGSLILNFTVAGTYTVKLKNGNPNCGIDSITKTICVSSKPTASFITNSDIGCGSLIITTNNTSNLPECGTNRYSWSVSLVAAGACTAISPAFEYIDGTNATSENPHFSFNSPGTYTISLTNTFIASGCSSIPFTKTITVKGKPKISINNISAICQNQTISPSALTTCNIDAATIYDWSFPGGSPSSSTLASPGPITYNSAGDYSVSLSVTNECGTSTTSKLFTVKPLPVVIVPSSVPICTAINAGPFTFSTTLSGVLSWTNNNTTIGLGSTGTGSTIGSFITTNTTTSTQTATITVKSMANSCSATNSFDISVYPKVNNPIVSTPVSYCTNETPVALTATASSGNTLLWYTAATGGSGSTAAPTPVTITAGTFGYYVSQVSSPASCESQRELIRVIVNPIPSFTVTPNNPSSCGVANGSIVLSSLAANTIYTVSYTKNTILVTSSRTSNSAGSITIGSLSPGLYEHITVTASGCISPEAGPFTLTDPNPPVTPVAVNDGPLCSGKKLQLTSSTSSAGTRAWVWTGPNSFTSTIANPAISNVAVAAAGVYTVTVTINNCTSQPATTTVVIDPSPATPMVNSNSPVCSGNDVNLTASSATTGVSYAWAGPSSYTSIDQNPVITNAPATASGTYTVTATLGNCTAQASTIVTVNPTPAISNATATDPTTCSSSTGLITLKGLTPGTSYTVTYTKNTAPQSVVRTATGSGDIIITGLTAGVYDNILVTASNCASNIKGPFTLSDPTPPATPVASNNGAKCAGQTLTLSATAVTSATYAWTGPNGFTSTQANPVIPNVTTAAAGTYNLTIKVSGCSSPVATTTAVINPTPVITNITGSTPVCTNNTIQLSASTGFTDAFSWSWTGPNGFTATIATPSITNASLAAAGTYSVTATAVTGNCASVPATVAIVVNLTPAISSSTKDDPTACSTATGAIHLNGLETSTAFTIHYLYNSNPVTTTITSTAGGVVNITGLAAGLYEHIYVTAKGCSSNEAGPFILTDPTPPLTPIAGSNSPLCVGQTLNLTATSATTGTLSYVWSGPNGFTSIQQQPSIAAITMAGAGNYTVKAILHNCSSATATVPVVVNPLGATPAVSTPVTYCKEATAIPLSVTPATGNTLNWYTVPVAGISTATAPTPATVTPGTTSYYVSQTTTAGCEGVRARIDVVIHPDAIASYNFARNTDCAPFVLNPSVIKPVLAPARNSSYEWYANNAAIGTGTSFPGYTIQQPGDSITIKLKAISLFGCKNDSVSYKFFTIATPQPAFTVNTTGGCGPLSVQFNNTTPNPAQFNFTWNFGNGITSNSAQPGTVVFQPNPGFGDTTYKVTLSVTTACETITATQNILVKSKPKALFTPAQPFGCSPFTTSFVNTSKGNNLAFTWNFDDGTIINTNQPDAQQHTFTTGIQDTFHVQLQVTNECGSDAQSYAVVVSPNKIKLNLGINGNERTGCQPLTVHFINNTSGATGFHWDFGDGSLLNTTKNIDTVTHVFLQPGSFTVTLQASNGCSDTTTTRTIQVFEKPKADFSLLPNPACVGETVSFKNLTPAATGISWRFADGFTSNAQNPTRVFTTAGNYPVTLIATLQYSAGNVCIDSITKPLQVGPSGTFSYDHGYICGNTPVRFEVVTPDAGQVKWDFGDGQSQTTTAKIIYHTYSQTGNYVPVATLIQNANCSLKLQPGDTIKVDYVQAGFISQQQKSCGSTYVLFTDTSRTRYGIQNWNWQLGNSQTATQQHPATTYLSTQDYFVQLTVTAVSGCKASFNISMPVKVNNRPQSAIAAAVKGCEGQQVTYEAIVNSTDPVTQYRWLFSDNGSALGQQVQHVYGQAGNYNAQLISGTGFGCYDTVSKPIQVYPSPVVRASADQLICKGKTYPLNASGANTYSWTPQDGSLSCTTCASTIAYPQGTTQYIVQGSNADGCSRQDTILITVVQPIHIQVNSNDTICIGQKAALSVTGASRYQWTPAATLDLPTSANPVATPVFTTRYQVIGFDNYQCFQDTAYTTVAVGLYPKLNLGPDTVLATGTLFPLNSTLTNGPARQWNWTPATDLSCTNCALPVATIKNNTCYTTTATNNYGCSASDTICIRVFCEGTQVYIPNLFTPDNDGHNDRLIVRGKGIVQVKSFRIFNRWGQVVFERSNFAPNDASFGWDGTIKGIAAPPDVYVYTCDVLCENGTPYTYKGNVAIIK